MTGQMGQFHTVNDVATLRRDRQMGSVTALKPVHIVTRRSIIVW